MRKSNNNQAFLTFESKATRAPFYKMLLKELGEKAHSNDRNTIIYFKLDDHYTIEIWKANTRKKNATCEIDMTYLFDKSNPSMFGYWCIRRVKNVPQGKALEVINTLSKFPSHLKKEEVTSCMQYEGGKYGPRTIYWGFKEGNEVDENEFLEYLRSWADSSKKSRRKKQLCITATN